MSSSDNDVSTDASLVWCSQIFAFSMSVRPNQYTYNGTASAKSICLGAFGMIVRKCISVAFGGTGPTSAAYIRHTWHVSLFFVINLILKTILGLAFTSKFENMASV